MVVVDENLVAGGKVTVGQGEVGGHDEGKQNLRRIASVVMSAAVRVAEAFGDTKPPNVFGVSKPHCILMVFAVCDDVDHLDKIKT